MPARVHNRDQKLLRRLLNLMSPVIRISQPAMQKKNRRPCAKLREVHIDPIDLRKTAASGLRQGRRGRQREPPSHSVTGPLAIGPICGVIRGWRRRSKTWPEAQSEETNACQRPAPRERFAKRLHREHLLRMKELDPLTLTWSGPSSE